jgi:hypothetical protein
MGGLLPIVHLLSSVVSEEQEYTSVLPLEFSGVLDLAGLAVATWTLWVFLSLPLQGTLQRAFRFISIASLAFAFSHVLDSLVGALDLLPGPGAILLAQGEVLVSILLFVPGLVSLADSFPQFSPAQASQRPFSLWPPAVGFIIGIASLSFILYGISPQAEVIAFLGINGCLVALTVVCCWLLIRAGVRGAVGFSLWLAMLGLILFSMAHPLQAWMVFQPGNALYGPVFHRLIVMPAFFLFAFSMTHLARRISRYPLPQPTTLPDMTRPHVVPLVRVTKPMGHREKEPLKVLDPSRLR